MNHRILSGLHPSVAPLAGAWIEIPAFQGYATRADVAPLAGAWIEMKEGAGHLWASDSRSTRGSVD